MAKITTKHEIHKNWQTEFQDSTKAEVLEWIAENVPDGYTFGYEYGYECATYGNLYIEVTETDEEEAARMSKEAADQIRRKQEREERTLAEAKKILKERKANK